MELYLDFVETLIESVETDELLEADMKALPAPEGKQKISDKAKGLLKNISEALMKMVKVLYNGLMGLYDFVKKLVTKAGKKFQYLKPIKIMGYDYGIVNSKVPGILKMSINVEEIIQDSMKKSDPSIMANYDLKSEISAYLKTINKGEEKDITSMYINWLGPKEKGNYTFTMPFADKYARSAMDTLKKLITEKEKRIKSMDTRVIAVYPKDSDAVVAANHVKRMYGGILQCTRIAMQFITDAVKQDYRVYKQITGREDKEEIKVDKSKVVVEEAFSFLIQ